MRRVDAQLEEVQRANRQALQEGATEPQMITRAKGKGTMLSEAERQEQYNKLKEEELHCRAMQKKLKEQRQMLEKCKHHHSRGRLPQPTHGSTRHLGFTQRSFRSKRTLTAPNRMAKSTNEEVTSDAGTTMSQEPHYPKNWKKCNGPIISTQQFCPNSMESPIRRSSYSSTKQP